MEQDGPAVKLKMWQGESFIEMGCLEYAAQILWDRFKAGPMTEEEMRSIFGVGDTRVPPSRQTARQNQVKDGSNA
jgi:hypothetical protein